MNSFLIIAILLWISIIIFILYHQKRLHLREDFRSCAIRDEKLNEIKNKLITLHPKASSMTFCIDDQESYTEDKFKTYMCLKDKQGNYYPDNMLIYVAIHELAHAISKQVDPKHETQEFHQNFNYLLKKAEEAKYYNPSIPPLENYCNLTK